MMKRHQALGTRHQCGGGVMRGVGFLAALMLGVVAGADTNVPPGNLGTQTWTLANSPYVLSGDVAVLAGSTLTGEAGGVGRVQGGDAGGGGVGGAGAGV